MLETIEKRFDVVVNGQPDVILVLIVRNVVSSPSGPYSVASCISLNLESNGMPVERKRGKLVSGGIAVQLPDTELAAVYELFD